MEAESFTCLLLHVQTGVPGVTGLACDWLSGNLLWTNERTASIHMLANGGKSYTTVLSKNVAPSELVVLPVDR